MAVDTPRFVLGPAPVENEDQVATDRFVLDPPPKNEELDQQFYDDTFLGELGEGIVSGASKVVEGVAGLASIVPDVVLGTNYGDKVTETAENFRDSLGIDPTGVVGVGAEVVSQFVYLPVKAASLAGKGYMAARALRKGKAASTPLTKGERFALASKQLGAAGLAEVAVATDGTTTIGDWVEMGPTQTEDLIGLHGQEKALARLGNRAKIAGESLGVGTVVGGALGALGRSAPAQGIAKNASAKLEQAGKNIDDLLFRRATAAPGSPEELGKFKSFVADALAFSRYRGFLPEQVATKRLLVDPTVQNEIKKAELTLKKVEKEIDASLKKMKPNSKLDRVGIMTKIEDFLTEADEIKQAGVLKEIPVEIRPNVQNMRSHITELSQKILDGDFLRSNNFVTKSGQNLDDVIKENLNSYLRRRFRVFEDSKYVPTEKSIVAARGFFKANKPATEKELTRLAQGDAFGTALPEDFLTTNGLTRVGAGDDLKIEVGGKITDEVAKKVQESFLAKYSIKSREKLSGGRIAKDRLNTGLFVSKEQIPKELRRLLGEISDPREAYLGTISDLAQFAAVDDYFGTVAKLATENQGSALGKMFVNPAKLTEQQKAGLKGSGYVELGSESAPSIVTAAGREVTEVEAIAKNQGWGSLTGYMVPRSVYKDLTNSVLAEDSFGALITRGVVGTFLKGKGISQYSKTVLSPITQVRNFTTAVSFALANGNIPMIGRGGSLKDSAQLVFANITNKGSDAVFADLLEAQRRGVLGTGTELREIQDTLNKGLEITGRAPRNFSEAVLGESLSKAISKVTTPLENVYQGSDDFWKYFSYNAEQAKLRNALAKSTDDQKLAYLTKNGSDLTPEQSLKLDNTTNPEEFGSLLDELIKDRAAQIVRDTVPNYNKAASDLIKFGRKLPVGSFITFPAEMYRTSFNIVKQALDDMASDIPAIQARGRQRLIGFTSVAVVAPLAAADVASAVSDVPKDVMEAYKRSFGAPWEKGATLLALGQDKETGKLSYSNFSTSNPYDTLFRFANRAATEGQKSISEGQNPDDVMIRLMTSTLGEFFAPFLDEAMLTESLLDITVRGGRTGTGAQVFNPEDSYGAKGSKMFLHVMDTLLPSLVPMNVSGGEIEPSRFARGLVGSMFPDLINPKDKLGRERELTTELFRQFSGVTPLEFDPNKSLVYAARRFQRSQSDARRIFNSKVDDRNATPESLKNAYIAANEAKLRIDRQYYQMFQDLKTLGMTSRDIKKILKTENIGGVRSILRGEFDPFNITDTNKRKMKEAGIRELFPREEIRDLRNSFKRLPLDERREASPEPLVVDNTSSPERFVLGPAPTVVSAPATPIVAASSTESTNNFGEGLLNRARTFAPGLLGDPKNQAIVDRAQDNQ